MKNAFGIFAVAVNRAASSPLVTGVAFVLVAIWGLSGPLLHFSDSWQLAMNTLSSVITFLMVFILNYAQNRDTAAINTKLDALILSLERADNRIIGLEHLPHTEAEAIQHEVHSLKEIAAQAAQILSEEG